jgi:hypothetical protein
MRMSEQRLRRVIRSILREQVVGYTPPSKGEPDEGYEDFGDISTAMPSKTSITGEPADRQHLDTEEQETTKQRQQDMNKGDAVAANDDAETAARLRRNTG